MKERSGEKAEGDMRENYTKKQSKILRIHPKMKMVMKDTTVRGKEIYERNETKRKALGEGRTRAEMKRK